MDEGREGREGKWEKERMRQRKKGKGVGERERKRENQGTHCFRQQVQWGYSCCVLTRAILENTGGLDSWDEL